MDTHVKMVTVALLVALLTCLLPQPAPAADAPLSVELTEIGARLLAQGDDHHAADQLIQAITVDPGNLLARRLLARAELNQGYAKAAVEIVEPVAKLEPTAANLTCLADAYFALGKTAIARDKYTLALKSKPGDVDASIGLANLLVAHEDYEQARRVLLSALDQTHDKPGITKLTQKLKEIQSFCRPQHEQTS